MAYFVPLFDQSNDCSTSVDRKISDIPVENEAIDAMIRSLLEDREKTLQDVASLFDCDSPKSIDAQLSAKGYKMSKTSANETIYERDGSLYRTVGRWFDNRVLYLCEPIEDFFSDRPSYAIGSGSKEVSLLFEKMRPGFKSASICTNNMPLIAAGLMRNVYGVSDVNLLVVTAGFLTQFASKRKKQNSGSADAFKMLFPQTERFICFAPEELDCIAQTCVQIIEEADKAGKAVNFDVEHFIMKLKRNVEGRKIKLPADICLFGRWINGWGLSESNSCVEINTPIRIS